MCLVALVSRCFHYPFPRTTFFVVEGKVRKQEKHTRATVFRGPFDVRIEQVPDATRSEPSHCRVVLVDAKSSHRASWALAHESSTVDLSIEGRIHDVRSSAGTT